MIGFIYTLYIRTVRNYRQYSAIAVLHTVQFTVAHTPGFSAVSSRILATDLSVPLSLKLTHEVFLAQSNYLRLPSPENQFFSDYCSVLPATATLLLLCFSESELLNDWQFTVNQFVLKSSNLRPATRDFFRNWTLAVHPLWREDGFVSYEYVRPFVKCIFRTYSILLKYSSFCTIRKCSVSTDFAEHVMPSLHVLCYDGSLVTWMLATWPP
jgi:hypothetical protein